jgi:hypothetical protein
MTQTLPPFNMRALYDRFNEPVTAFDCGARCAPYNPSGKPFCCDICHAVPVAYTQEWTYLEKNTDLWHTWRGDECESEPADPAEMQAEAPDYMRLLACKGPAHCQRPYRAISCRQFPFFPYVTADFRFIGLAYEWEFEKTCWVISHLASVTPAYRAEFIRFYDELFSLWQDEFESYAGLSAEMRATFATQKRRIPLLHRNGQDYLLSPNSERLQRVTPSQYRRFGPYLQAGQ